MKLCITRLLPNYYILYNASLLPSFANFKG